MSHIYPTNVIEGGISNHSWPGSAETPAAYDAPPAGGHAMVHVHATSSAANANGRQAAEIYHIAPSTLVTGYPTTAAAASGTAPRSTAVAAAASTAIASTVAAAAASPSRPSLQLGIPTSIVLAPIIPPPKKQRKSNDEFTILERLKILSELKGPNAISVPDLAAKHRTSRTSIYRWKKDLPRLLKLSKKSDGTQHKKRVPIKKKGNRKSTYNEEFSAIQKLRAIRELSSTSEGGSNPPPSVRTVAAKIGANYRSVYRWRKDEARLIQLVEQDGKGNSKRLIRDPMGRIKEALKLFYESHTEQQQNADGVYAETGAQSPPPITGPMLALKAIQIRDEMLAQHEISPFLSEMELKGMREFTGSASWGRKVLHKLLSRNEEKEEQYGNASSPPQQQQHHHVSTSTTTTNQSTTSRKTSNTSSTQKQQHQKIRDMKREITMLKKKLHGSEAHVLQLEEENAALRVQITTLTMGGGSGDAGAFHHHEEVEEEDDVGEEEAEEGDEEDTGGEEDGYKEEYY